MTVPIVSPEATLMPAPSLPASGAVTPTGTLQYRLATDEDKELLLNYRYECGWGADRIIARWKDPDYPLCVLWAEIDGEFQPVGMGGWILEQEGSASKKDRWVKLASLAIGKKFQGCGLGRSALELLEKVAGERYNALIITLDTAAYQCDPTDDENGFIEYIGTESRNSKWYKRNGYEAYGEIVPLYQNPAFPDRKISAVHFKKQISPSTSSN